MVQWELCGGSRDSRDGTLGAWRKQRWYSGNCVEEADGGLGEVNGGLEEGDGGLEVVDGGLEEVDGGLDEDLEESPDV